MSNEYKKPFLEVNKEGDLLLRVHLLPRSSRHRIVGEHGDALKIAVTAPPVENAANDELVRLVAKKFKLPRRQVQVISGKNSRKKLIKIVGVSLEEAYRVLEVNGSDG
jgi:uncharacterized protein (TIGR00251 family)